MNQHGMRVLPRSESPWGNLTPQNRTYRTWDRGGYFFLNRTYANCVKKQGISPKASLFPLFNPLNPPYQGDFERKCVSPIKLTPMVSSAADPTGSSQLSPLNNTQLT